MGKNDSLGDRMKKYERENFQFSRKTEIMLRGGYDQTI